MCYHFHNFQIFKREKKLRQFVYVIILHTNAKFQSLSIIKMHVHVKFEQKPKNIIFTI
jgi:hypothetical protein